MKPTPFVMGVAITAVMLLLLVIAGCGGERVQSLPSPAAPKTVAPPTATPVSENELSAQWTLMLSKLSEIQDWTCEHKALAENDKGLLQTYGDFQAITYCDVTEEDFRAVMLKFHPKDGHDMLHSRGLMDIGNNKALSFDCLIIGDREACNPRGGPIDEGMAWLLELRTVYESVGQSQ